MPDRSPLEQFYYWEANTPNNVYLRQARDRQWIEYTWKDVGLRARTVATFLQQQALPEKSRIAIYAKNCAEWFIVDLAIMMAGHTSVPLYPGQTVNSIRYVLNHSDSLAIFIGLADKPEDIDAAADARLLRIGLPGCRVDVTTDLDHIFLNYPPIRHNPIPDIDDLFTIMYTSGTTGNPKGVMHHFRNATFAVTNIVRAFGLDENTRLVSYLPLSHAAERVIIEMQSLYIGAVVSFPESLDTFIEDLNNAKPTLFFSVPRLWQKFKEGVETNLSPNTIKLLLKIPIISTWFKYQVRKKLGLANAAYLITGAAPMPIEIQDWYMKLGMPIRDGYGMTENFVYGTICIDQPVPGTVGKTFNNSEVKISDEGEVLFKSEALMSGYYREPEKTAEVLRDGYYHTGDSGHIDKQGYLRITGRLSEVFKTSKGKFIKPMPLENLLGEIPQLGQLCVTGHGLNQPIALAGLSDWGKKQSPDAITLQITKALEKINASLPSHERIAQIFIVHDEWTIDNEMLTPTMKLKRHRIADKYHDLLRHDNGSKVIVWEKTRVLAYS